MTFLSHLGKCNCEAVLDNIKESLLVLLNVIMALWLSIKMSIFCRAKAHQSKVK